MNKLSTLFFGIVSFVLFIILFFYTFVVKDFSDLENVNFSFQTSGKEVFFVNGEYVQSLEGAGSGTSVFASHVISPIEYFYFQSGSVYKIDEDNDITNIELTNGQYYFYLNDINKKYHIKAKGFNFDFIGGGSFFLYVSGTKHILLSMDAIINANLVDDKTDNTLTTMYVFPHQFIKISPLRNYSLKNADRLRFSSVNSIGSILSPFFIKGALNEDISYSQVGLDIAFIKNVLGYENQMKNQYSKENGFLKYVFPQFPGLVYIEKYKYLFLNENKKLAYLKNTFGIKVFELFSKEEKDTGIINDIYNTAMEIKKINEEEFKNIVNFYSKYYYFFILNRYKGEPNEKIINFSELSAKLNGIQGVKYDISNLTISNIFNKYDYVGEESFLPNINSFSDGFLSDLNKDNSKLFIDYYVYFLQQILISDYALESSSFISILNIMGKYIDISEMLYSDGDEKKIKTGLYVHLEVLKNIVNYAQLIFFYPRESEASLLTRNLNNSLDLKYVNTFDNNINKLLKFFVKNKDFFNSNEAKDKLLIDEYGKVSEQYNEIILALSDYDSYVIKYDDIKSKLLSLDTYQTNDNDMVLSVEKAYTYLSQFEGLNLFQSEITINEEGGYYEIKNVIINGSMFSFSLYPNNSFLLTDIQINGESTKYSYKLAQIEEKLQELIQGAQELEDSLIFSKFFLVTFFGKNSNSNELIVDDESKNDAEDKVIRVFKSTKLLGKRGEFGIFDGYMNIPYDTLIVALDNNNYNIKIDGANFLFKINSLNVRNNNIQAYIKSSYKLGQNEHYFYGLSLNFFEIIETKKEKYLGGERINIVENVDLSSFKQMVSLLSSSIETINLVILKIQSYIMYSNMSIDFTPSTNQTLIKFDFNEKAVNIALSGTKIFSFSIEGKSLLMDGELEISLDQFDNYLQIMKNIYGKK